MPDNNKVRKLILLSLMLATVVGPTLSAAPEPLTDQQIEQIRQNCVGAQTYLQTIQRNDAAARINRGRAYESMTKLLANFNSRVVLNKLDAPLLPSATSKIETKFTAFQAHYLSYDDALTAALKVNCREQPVTFYDTLTSVRELRATLEQDVKDINAQLDEYQRGVTELRTRLAQPAKAEATQ